MRRIERQASKEVEFDEFDEEQTLNEERLEKFYAHLNEASNHIVTPFQEFQRHRLKNFTQLRGSPGRAGGLNILDFRNRQTTQVSEY